VWGRRGLADGAWCGGAGRGRADEGSAPAAVDGGNQLQL
jgi:hypothetical protein